jgi:hypothetical protein
MIFYSSIDKFLMLHDFSSSIDKQNLLMSFATRYLVMGSNVIVW